MQNSYTYPEAIVGQIGTYATGDIVSVLNPLRAQVTNLEYFGITADGTYALQVSGTDGSSATSDGFVAVGQTAAQICAGIVAGCLSDPEFAGLISAAAVITTDNVLLTFQKAGVVYTVTPTFGAPTQSNTVTAGYTNVALGIILQSSGSSFTTTFTNAALALGVTCRNAELVLPIDQNGVSGYDGPCMMSLVRRGEIFVNVTGSVVVGEAASFDPATGTWDQAGTGGAFVDVPESQFRTSGSGIQRVFVNLPSET